MRGDRKRIAAAVADQLQQAGFSRQGVTWRRTTPVGVDVFEIGTSIRGGGFFWSCGVYLRALGSDETPPERLCHIRTVAGAVEGPLAAELGRALDFDSTMEPSVRTRVCQEAMARAVLPWFERLRTADGIREFLRTDQARHGLIHWQVHELFGSDKSV